METTSLRRFLVAVGLVGLSALATGQTSCATTDSSGGTADADASADVAVGCGAPNTPCCAPTGSCEPGLFCNENTCKPQQVTDIGKACKVNADCESGLCGYVQFPPSSTGDDSGTNEFAEGGGPPSTSVCTTGCTADSQCMPGWSCTELAVGQGTCTCSAILELCNGKDDNCNGIIDDEPWADQDCSNNAGVPEVCKAATCGCVNSCQGTCVDLQNDPTNCGTCGTNCDPNLQICQKGACVCGNEAGTVKICGGQCVDTASDAKNCGSCGTPCDFTCATSACGPTTITSSASIFGKVFTLDATTVYWLDTTAVPSVLDSCPITGCTKPTQLTTTSASPSALVLANGTLYWNDSITNTIFSCPTGGCKAAKSVYTDTNTSDSMQGFTADATNVYFVEQDSSANTRVFRCASTGCTTGTNVIGGTGVTSMTSALVIDGTNLVWFDGTNLLLCASAGCAAPEKIPTPKNLLFLNDLAAGGGTVVYTDGTSVYTSPEDPKGKVATLATSTGFTSTPSGVATDGTNAYWSMNATPSGTIEKCPVAGCPGSGPDAGGSPTTLVPNLDAPTFIQLGPSALAWLQGSSTTRVEVFSK